MVLISFYWEGKEKELARGSFAGGRVEMFLPQSSGNFPLPLAHSLADLCLSLPKLQRKSKKKEKKKRDRETKKQEELKGQAEGETLSHL